ncbi:MAG: SsrA-binding protein SmpB [Candidatus Shapirobacteria bacterium]|nr:SsrA-binding protein SmpB [Candidatus Shapirobacteria bacterium]
MKKIVNRRASFDYQILAKFEVGVVLSGAEVKSIKNGHLKLEEAFIRLKDHEAWLFNAHIHPYSFAANQEEDPRRARKLLLHKKELLKLKQETTQKGLTIVPLSCYTKHNKIKLEIALAKGKKKYEKREAIKKKDWRRELKV